MKFTTKFISIIALTCLLAFSVFAALGPPGTAPAEGPSVKARKAGTADVSVTRAASPAKEIVNVKRAKEEAAKVSPPSAVTDERTALRPNGLTLKQTITTASESLNYSTKTGPNVTKPDKKPKPAFSGFGASNNARAKI